MANKHNKELFLPQNDSPNVESAHQIRRVELNRVFDRVKSCSQSDKRNELSETNLSKNEQLGLKSLRKRINDGSLVICDSDKSKRFCALTKDQYIAAGSVHTEKDTEISAKIKFTIFSYIIFVSHNISCSFLLKRLLSFKSLGKA